MRFHFLIIAPLLNPGIECEIFFLTAPFLRLRLKENFAGRKSRCKLQLLLGTVRQGDTRQNVFRTFGRFIPSGFSGGLNRR